MMKTVFVIEKTRESEKERSRLNMTCLPFLLSTLDSDASDSESEDEDMDDSDPVLESKAIKHHGAVNRIRSTQIGETTLAATWSDVGKVHLWDLSYYVKSLDAPQHEKAPGGPLFSFSGHAMEGFSMDWSPTSPGRCNF